MRRQLVAQTAEFVRIASLRLLPKLRDFANQPVNLPLLACNQLVQVIEQVFAEAGLDFQIGEALVGALVSGQGVVHAGIGLDRAWTIQPRPRPQPKPRQMPEPLARTGAHSQP